MLRTFTENLLAYGLGRRTEYFDQPTIRDNSISIAQLIAQASAKTGENIQVHRFVRFRVGDSE